MKNRKRILSVRIKRMMDTDPDTSYLGEYSDRPKSEFAIDRAHSEDCAGLEHNHFNTVDKLERIFQHIATWRHQAGNDEIAQIGLDEACDIIGSLQDEVSACDCGEHGDMGRYEFRYFNPGSIEAFNPDASWIPKTVVGLAARREYWRKDMLSNAKQDYERMESYHNQNWYYVGIRAEAKVYIGQSLIGGLGQTITSGGLWGIESDSEESYLQEIGQQELAELKTQLIALGFSRRAISTAFKNVEEVSE